ncbi:unnamed protein product [Didymodactylos carnosus]|nr:unnamed protein product [Didymodactylos carnosus]CAF3843352.1 unnamed protein product [Didymodactylos carnosus]
MFRLLILKSLTTQKRPCCSNSCLRSLHHTIRGVSKSKALNIVSQTLSKYVWQSIDELPDDEKYRAVQIEIDVLRDAGYLVPNVITRHYCLKLYDKPLDIRKDSYEFLHDREQKRLKHASIQAQKAARRQGMMKYRESLLIQGIRAITNYPGHHTIFRHVTQKHFKINDLTRLAMSARLQDYVFIDCSFEKLHVRQSYHYDLLKKVYQCFNNISRYHSPSFVYLCNVQFDLKRFHSQTLIEFNPMDNLSFEVTSKSYLDYFPKEKFIYLTPDANNDMVEYDHDAIYIIGGIFDKSGKDTLEKAQREQIRTTRFPLDRYLKFHPTCYKDLTLDQVYNILMTLKHTKNNWYKALKWVPDRKLSARYKWNETDKDYQYVDLQLKEEIDEAQSKQCQTVL